MGMFLHKVNRIEETRFCPKMICILKKEIARPKKQNKTKNIKISLLSSIVAVSIYIPTNSAIVFPFLHTLSSIYCL